MTVTAGSGRPLLLRNVTIVDTGDGALTPRADVRVSDGAIAAITTADPDAAGSASPADAEVVDGSGRYLIPGYLDMHAHPLTEKHPAGDLELMLAHGVTGFRQMSGSPRLLAERAAGTLPRPADSPDVVALPGALLTPLNAGTIEDAVAAIRAQAAAGADFIKVALITPRVFFPAVAEARKLGIEILQQAVDTFSEERAAELAGQFAEDGTWQVPTLIRLRTQYLCDSPEFSEDPDLQYMARSTRKSWQNAAGSFATKFTPQSRATFRAVYEVLLRMTKIFNDGGVRMLAGSDSVGAAWEVPGPSLHREFDELARAGLPPLRILQMTTRDAAEFLGASATLGSVEVGKQADLVLLDANPLDAAANLHQVSAVVRRGRHYSAADLARLKDRVRTAHPAT